MSASARRNSFCRRRRPQRMQLRHDAHLVPHRVANLAERHEGGLEIGGGDGTTFARLGREIERPDLHRRDALLEQRMCELVGAMQERIQVLVGPSASRSIDAPVVRLLPAWGTNVSVAGAGVIDANAIVREAAQALMQRLPGCLTEQVPQGDVHSRSSTHLHPTPGKSEILVLQRPPMPVQLQCGFAEQQGRHRLVDVCLDSARAEERLP